MGHMELVVFSRKWGHKDRYVVKRTTHGWYIEFGSIKGDSDKTGAPYLFEILNNDSINYPADLGGCMEWLWREAEERHLSDKGIQCYLNELGEWVQKVEKSTPQKIERYTLQKVQYDRYRTSD